MWSQYQVAETFRQLIVAALADANSEAITTSYVAVGQVAWDDCCGQLTVGPTRTFRYVEWPNEASGEEQCFGGSVGVELLVTLVRCVPTPDSAGNPPTAVELDTAHRNVLEDAAVIWNTVACEEFPEDWQRASVSQVFVGGEGGCVAVETRFLVGLDCECWNLAWTPPEPDPGD